MEQEELSFSNIRNLSTLEYLRSLGIQTEKPFMTSKEDSEQAEDAEEFPD